MGQQARMSRLIAGAYTEPAPFNPLSDVETRRWNEMLAAATAEHWRKQFAAIDALSAPGEGN